MIFVTVGHQMPFDRMIQIVDSWAAKNPDSDVFAQIGMTRYSPVNIKYTASLTPTEFDNKMLESDIVIAHAGTGTIIKALELKKPILVMARQAASGETRNDHQTHTIKLFEKRGYFRSFSDVPGLTDLLNHRPDPLAQQICGFASKQLITTISEFISN